MFATSKCITTISRGRHTFHRMINVCSNSFESNEMRAAIPDLKKLGGEDGISLLQNIKNGRLVVMIGTVHVSEESVKVVRRIIQSCSPDTVMIELDQKRVGLESEELAKNGFVLPKNAIKRKNQAPAEVTHTSYFTLMSRKFIEPVYQLMLKLVAVLFHKAIGRVYQSIEKLGLNAGEEFEAAYQIGREIKAKVLLGDRDVDLTFDRLASALLATKFSR